MNNELKWKLGTHRMSIESLQVILDRSTNTTNGDTGMPDEEVKMSLIVVKDLIKHQMELIDAVYEVLTKPKTPWYKRIFKK